MSVGGGAGDGHRPDEVDVLVIGAGQAGLGTAYWLRRCGIERLLVVDAQPVGQSWLDRWDSLRLFTPHRSSALPGLAFPDGPHRAPSRVEMAPYLSAYAAHPGLPVETGVRISRLTGDPEGLMAWTSTGASLRSAR
ncbi:Pyridine nucleotide-disulphide oxidoreductase [Modestobacter sp. DSM 44400]|uniref:FAD-dependent oxidoreductase n=1 Tax=Modestobacter sp. DSM 44400 TaxID=1550230 RepID=UPI0008985534|nr:FAD-dependent oxidoreductase [Modestobacter sp. DSM 44400]SDY04969.1 Pyridine nucleotide-disulphide oxidoreductase [Modestobacter sp. DSM 44400]